MSVGQSIGRWFLTAMTVALIAMALLTIAGSLDGIPRGYWGMALATFGWWALKFTLGAIPAAAVAAVVAVALHLLIRQWVGSRLPVVRRVADALIGGGLAALIAVYIPLAVGIEQLGVGVAAGLAAGALALGEPPPERRRWWMVVSLFSVLAFVFGYFHYKSTQDLIYAGLSLSHRI